MWVSFLVGSPPFLLPWILYCVYGVSMQSPIQLRTEAPWHLLLESFCPVVVQHLFWRRHFLLWALIQDTKIYTLRAHSCRSPSLNLCPLPLSSAIMILTFSVAYCELSLSLSFKEPLQAFMRILDSKSWEISLFLINVPCFAIYSEPFSVQHSRNIVINKLLFSATHIIKVLQIFGE